MNQEDSTCWQLLKPMVCIQLLQIFLCILRGTQPTSQPQSINLSSLSVDLSFEPGHCCHSAVLKAGVDLGGDGHACPRDGLCWGLNLDALQSCSNLI